MLRCLSAVITRPATTNRTMPPSERKLPSCTDTKATGETKKKILTRIFAISLLLGFNPRVAASNMPRMITIAISVTLSCRTLTLFKNVRPTQGRPTKAAKSAKFPLALEKAFSLKPNRKTTAAHQHSMLLAADDDMTGYIYKHAPPTNPASATVRKPRDARGYPLFVAILAASIWPEVLMIIPLFKREREPTHYNVPRREHSSVTYPQH